MTTDTPKFILVLAEAGKLRTYTTVKAISRALEEEYFRGASKSKIELFSPAGTPLNSSAVLGIIMANRNGCQDPSIEPYLPFTLNPTPAMRAQNEGVTKRNKPRLAAWRRDIEAQLSQYLP